MNEPRCSKAGDFPIRFFKHKSCGYGECVTCKYNTANKKAKKVVRKGTWVKGTGKDLTLIDDVGQIVKVNKDKKDKLNVYLVRWDIQGGDLQDDVSKKDRQYWTSKSDVRVITPKRAKKIIFKKQMDEQGRYKCPICKQWIPCYE